jgi:capsular exopolysaccharide synthesis family protein
MTPVSSGARQQDGHAASREADQDRVRPLMPGLAPAQSQQEDDEIDLMQLVGTIWRGKWIVALCFLLAVLAGGYYAYGVAVPKYAAEARVVLESRDQNVVDVQSVMSGTSTDAAALNTEISIMTARTLMERLVRELNLTADPEFNGALREPSGFGPSEIIKLVRSFFAPVPEVAPPSEAQMFLGTVEAVRGAISVSNERNSYIFNIRAVSESPEKSAAIVNQLTEIYLDEQIATKFSATEYAVNWLSQRVTELELELKEKEEAVLELSSMTELMSQAALEALKAREKDLRPRVTGLQATRDTAREEAAELERLLEAEAYDAIAALAADPAIDELVVAATGGDAEAISGIEARVETLVSEARAAAAEAQEQLEPIEEPYEDLVAQIQVEDDKRQDLTQRVRDADATRVLYETFLARLKETSIQIGLQQADSRVLSDAIPGVQVEPRRARILALAGVLGIMLGVALVLLRQFVGNGFRTAEDLERVTGYSVLGQIPKMPGRRRRKVLDYLRQKPMSAAAEAIRNLRTSILLSNVDNPPRVILSTSSIPGEGKTTISIALAHNLAGLGKRVLVIEADIRRCTFNQYFDKGPGNLVQVVSGTLTLEEAVMTDKQLGIDVLMGEKSSINAADLFSSESFRQVVEAARDAYDYVIIDTPPVLVVPDARVIGRYADSIIYSVLWNETAQQQVVAGVRQLTSVNLRVAGLILSQIDPKGMKRYGYGGQYGAYAAYGSNYYDAS